MKISVLLSGTPVKILQLQRACFLYRVSPDPLFWGRAPRDYAIPCSAPGSKELGIISMDIC